MVSTIFSYHGPKSPVKILDKAISLGVTGSGINLLNPSQLTDIFQRLDNKLVPRSDNNTSGTPWRQIISLTNKVAIVSLV